MNPYLIDIPVLLIFMARPSQFRKVFEQVKLAKPSRLFLYQDGPRIGQIEDKKNIDECRKIAENIDWDCKVYKLYQDSNFGCDPSEYIAQKWMFSHVDRGIILEDDDVPSQSFFHFCKEMLDRYKNDTRINYICGMNHLGTYDNNTDDSYFFSSTGSIWGWATWKRSIDLWDENMTFLDDQNSLRLLEKNMGKRYFNHSLLIWKKHKASGKAYYESIHGSSFFLNAQLAIVPKKNLISNIGISDNSTHAVKKLTQLPPYIRKIFFMKNHELSFPLKHPKYIINDLSYRDKVNFIMGISNSPIIALYIRIRNFAYKLLMKIYIG